MSDFKNSKWRI